MNKLNISVYDLPNLEAFITQIEFLLSAGGVNIDEQEEKDESAKCYYPSASIMLSCLLKMVKFSCSGK